MTLFTCTTMSDNASQQDEELEALFAIYPDEWKKEIDDNAYSMAISAEVHLFITLNKDYPSSKPPKHQLLAPSLAREQKQEVDIAFANIYKNNLGGPVLFEWIEKLKEIVNEETQIEQDTAIKEEEKVDESSESDKDLYNIVHGPIIQDRKSTFQGHACVVEDPHQVREIMDILTKNKKVAHATHNILAYRISLKNGTILQDHDDDGETHAGGRLLHLLQILDVPNVIVIVSRWYGGIHLGPDRFRHINNAARQVLEQAGLIKKKVT